MDNEYRYKVSVPNEVACQCIFSVCFKDPLAVDLQNAVKNLI